MIQWCAYCQKFLTETAPFENLAVSHGVCQQCAKLAPKEMDEQVDTGRAIAELQGQLWTAAKSGDSTKIRELLALAHAIGVRSVDLLIGMISPLLYKVGDEWAKKVLTVADEHRITRFFESVYGSVKSTVENDSPAPNAKKRLDLLLVNAPNNHHTLAVRFLELWVQDRGYQALSIYPGLPGKEIHDLVKEYHPKAVGLSVSMESQMSETIDLVSNLSTTFPDVKFIVGGCAVKTGQIHPPKNSRARWSASLDDLVATLSA